MRLLTLARDLRRRKAREKERQFVVEGIRAVEELLRSPIEVIGLLAAPKLAESDRGQGLRLLATQQGRLLEDVDDREFQSASETDSPQGVLAVARVPDRSLDELAGVSPLRILLLDAVQDPGNVGTIIRTAAALGAHATVALPGTVDVWNAKVVRSAMGAHFHHAAFHAPWEPTHEFLEREQVPLWAADARGGSLPAEHPARLALVVGNEGGGLTSEVQAAAQRLVALPLAPSVESLNVAVAAGILLYELRA